MTQHDPDTARWAHMCRLSDRAALLARAEENRPDAQSTMFGLAEAQDIAAISPAEDDHVPTFADVYGAAAIFALLFAAGFVIREGLLIWGLL